jgi:general secretion pathway protein D
MNSINRLRGIAVVLPVVLLLLPQALDARKHPSENQLLKQAQAAEDRKDWDAALDLYKKALAVEPHNMTCQIGLQRTRMEAGQLHLQKGRELRQQGQLDAALAEFQKGFGDDPSSTIHLEEINTTIKMIEEAKKGPEKPPEERGLTPAEVERRDADERLRSIEGIPVLKPIQREVSTLKMNNATPRVLYETLGKLAGINVIIDPQFQPTVHNANLDLSNSNLEDALDYVALITHTFWKPITSNAIFVTDDNPTKRRDYESVAVKTFYLENPATAQDFQEIVTAVRSVSDCRRLYSAVALNALIARCTVDQLALVEKLIHDLDKPKAEVLVDILVLDVNTTHTRDLTASLQTSSGSGLTVPISYGPATSSSSSGASGSTGTTTPTATVTSNALNHISINQFSTTLPGALLNAVLSDSDTRVLQSPQIRASDGGKATLNIGSKIPFASGSYQAGVAGVGVSGLVQTQFQYADVGVNLTLQPKVHGDSEITMHVEVDISSVTGESDFSGLDEPIIGQKKSTTDLRVRDGEVTLLGGLLNTTDTDTSGGIPGLVNIPILGKLLFGNSHKERDKEELLIAIIPHIVRTEGVDALDMRGVAAGTDQTVQLRYSHPEEAPAPAPATVTQPVEPAPPAPPVTQPVVTPMAAPEGMPGRPGPRVTFSPATVETRVANPVAATLQIEKAADLFSVGVRVKWDPKVLRLNSIAPGKFLSADGQKLNAPIDIRNDAGEATINLTRLPGAPGVGGAGPLATFAFTAMAPGATNITVTEITPRNSKQEAIEVAAPAVAVVVR